MMYCVGDDILALVRSKKRMKSVEGLMELLLSMIKGRYHCVATDDVKFQKHIQPALQALDRLVYPSTFQVLMYLRKHFAETYAFVSQFSIRTHCIVGDVESYKIRKVEGKKEIVFTYSSGYTELYPEESACLVSENESDIRLYETLGENYLSEVSSESRNFFVSLKHSSGGGSQVGTTIQNNILINHQLTLAIVDSDKISADSANGKTALGALNALNDFANYQAAVQVYVLPVLEKENLFLPSEYLHLGTSFSKVQIENLNRLKRIENDSDVHGEFYIDYYDLKYGYSAENYRDMPETFRKFISKHEELFEIDKNRQKGSHITVGIDKRISNAIALDEICELPPSRLTKVRNEVGEVVSAWGISSVAERVI